MNTNTDIVETENNVLDNSIVPVKEKKEKIKKVKISKDELYKEDQIKIANNILNILDPTGNNTFTLYEIDNNAKIKKEIMDMVPEIKKKFILPRIRGITDNDKSQECKRPWLAVAHTIFKKLKYSIVRKNILVNVALTENDKPLLIRSQKYTISLPTM
jgi:hypothetical protein